MRNTEKSCRNCYWNYQCCEDNACEDFTLLDEETFESIILPDIRDRIKPRPERKLSRNYYRNRGVVYEDGCDTLDAYYVKMINDTLDEIRHGRLAYIFTLEQVEEVLSFEPLADVMLEDGIYYISLKKCNG